MPNNKNINKGYFLTVDVKRSTVTIPSDFRFYITDKRTSDLYVQLLINTQPNSVIKNYVGLEKAYNYRLTLNIIKPNNEPKEIKGKLIDEENAIFYYDLTDDCKDLIGKYKCEFYIECTVNSSKEAITSDSFEYTVSPSIFNDLDGPIESDEKYPILLDLIKRIEDLGGGGGGTTVGNTRIWFGEADPEPDPTKYDLWVTDDNDDVIDLLGSLQNEYISTIQSLTSRLKEAEEKIAELEVGYTPPSGKDTVEDAILLENGLPIILEDGSYLQLEYSVNGSITDALLEEAEGRPILTEDNNYLRLENAAQ